MGTETNSYEEARRQRVQENLKQLQCLGISKITKSLQESVKREKQSKCNASPKSKKNLGTIELRRSVRERKAVASYVDTYQDDDIDRRHSRRGNGSSTRTYDGRTATYEEQVHAKVKAEKLQGDLNFKNPSFVKPMVWSHVSSGFWLGLPTKFCKEHLPECDMKMVLEDEQGLEQDVVYIGSRASLSGGWKGFAVGHSLEVGDALVFELCKPDRFKVYIIKAIDEEPSQENSEADAGTEDKRTRSSEKKKNLHVTKKPPRKQAKIRGD